MKTFAIAAVVALAGLSALPVMANDNDNLDINGRSEFAIESALRDQGVAVTGVEEWGDYVRAWVATSDGGTTQQFFDIETLQPVSLYGG